MRHCKITIILPPMEQQLLDLEERKNQLATEIETKWKMTGKRLPNELVEFEKKYTMEILPDRFLQVVADGNTFILQVEKTYPFRGIISVKIIASDHIDLTRNYKMENNYMDNQHIKIRIMDYWSPHCQLDDVNKELNHFILNCQPFLI